MANKVETLVRDYLGIIKINNPNYNFLSSEVLRDLEAALKEFQQSKTVRIVAIKPDGIFSAGADVNEIWAIAQSQDRAQAAQLLKTANDIVNLVEDLGKPVIASINGHCLGGGNELAMACTVRIATTEARFGQPEINLGIIPGMGGTQRLPRLVGLRKALSLLTIGNDISANQALEIGLVDEVVNPEDLTKKTKILAETILENPPKREYKEYHLEEFMETIAELETVLKAKSPDAIKALLEAVRKGMATDLRSGLVIEQEQFIDVVMKESAMERIAKRFPHLKPVEKERPIAVTDDKTEEYKMTREMVREFANEKIKPHIAQMEAEHNLSPEIIQQMAELGLFGACFDEKYGGTQMGKVGYCTIIEELARVHGSSAVVFGAHVGLACGAINIGGNEEQKQKYLRAGIEGKMLGAFALTEPQAGSDAANIKTKAEKRGDKWVLNGSKQFITNGDIADFIVVIAQTNSDIGQSGLAAFIVETTWPGLEVGPNANKMGIRASRTTELFFTDLEVPEENVLGNIGEAFKLFMQTLNGGRMGLAAGCLGNSKGAFEEAYEHALNRVQFNKPILEQQIIQMWLAEMRSQIHLMEVAIYDAARKADRGEDTRFESAVLKWTCSEMTWDIVNKAFQILGGQAYVGDSPMERRLRDSRIDQIFEGTNQIQRLLIFKEIFRSQGKIN